MNPNFMNYPNIIEADQEYAHYIMELLAKHWLGDRFALYYGCSRKHNLGVF